MRDELLAYYERELTFLRQMGAQFAEKYPKVAARLALEPDRCEDPHVERMLEGFAFLAARVHMKIDDEFPEITQSLLNILYPHYLRPVPSMSVAEFQLDPEQNTPPEGLLIPKRSGLYSRPVDGLPFKFRTSYDVRLWPIAITAAQWTTPDRLQPPVAATDAVAALRIQVKCSGAARFSKLEIGALPFYLDGESNLVHALYELLCNNCARILVRDPEPGSKASPQWLHASNLRPLGFDEDEEVIPYPRRSFVGYRLLQEYFHFPEKFFFLELTGLDRLGAAGFTNTAEIVFFISPFQAAERGRNLEVGVSHRTLRLGCTPIVNLFAQTAEPVLLNSTRHEYPVVPDVSHPGAIEVFSVDEVFSLDPRLAEPVVFEPFYSSRYAASGNGARAFWHAARRKSSRPHDELSEVHLSLVDLSGRPAAANVEILTVKTTCTNGDLPSQVSFGSEKGDSDGDLDIEGAIPVKRITMLRKPSPTLRPPSKEDASWRLISHLSLNYLSLVDEGKDALQNILRLYNFSDSPYVERQIQAIASLRSQRRFARVASEHGVSFARGTKVDIELDESQFTGGGVYLFASVLERFLSLYASINSFSELSCSTVQRKEVLKHWQPRAGQRLLT